jgi:hypothetical protein
LWIILLRRNNLFNNLNKFFFYEKFRRGNYIKIDVFLNWGVSQKLGDFAWKGNANMDKL